MSPVTAAGRSFAIDGHAVAWGHWRFRFGFNPREGLVLYQLGFMDGERRRSIVYRASVSETVSRYASAGDVWRWMEFFDEGTLGLGELAVPALPGRDVPVNAISLPVVLAASEQPSFAETRENLIFIYERDAGALLSYRQGGRILSMPDTELVIGFMVEVGNYLYGFNWVLKQDGSFAFEAELAGEILTTLIREPGCDTCQLPSRPAASTAAWRQPFGTVVGAHVLGVSHQHWFNLRLDFDVDGPNNAVVENQLDGRGKQRFAVSHRVLLRSRQAERDVDDVLARSWTVVNPSLLGHGGHPVGYTIEPQNNARSLFDPARRQGTAAFTFHHFWVTRPASVNGMQPAFIPTNRSQTIATRCSITLMGLRSTIKTWWCGTPWARPMCRGPKTIR